MPARDSAGDSPTHRLSFPRSSKLLKHGDFQRVYKKGRRHFSGLLTAFYLPAEVGPASSQPNLRVGVTVGRALGGAVDRNRIKRRMREAIRKHLLDLPFALDLVFNPKKNVLQAEFSELEREVARAFQVIRKHMESTGTQAKPVAGSSC